MIRSHFVSGLFAMAAGLLALSACKPSGQSSERPSKNSAEVRFQVTVNVDTPDGPRSGSSIWSWKLSKPTIALGSPYGGKFRGEAVAVDLPNGKTLFALVKGQEMLPERHLGDIARASRGEEKLHEDRVADIRYLSGRIGDTATVPCVARTGEERGADRVDPKLDCPMLVSFADITEPASVFKVDKNDAAASLGSGYEIKDITITITDKPVTKGIEKRLGWLLDENRKRFDPSRKPEGIPLGNYRGLFSTELYK